MTIDQPDGTPQRHLGFKSVAIDNILETDPVVATMVSLNHATGEVKAQEYGDWVRIVTSVELDDQVPFEVRKAFMFSRGALCYAHRYYPALTLGMNDMLRVADFATSEACKERGINQPIRTKKGKFRYSTFAENIEALAATKVLGPRTFVCGTSSGTRKITQHTRQRRTSSASLMHTTR